MPDTPSSHSESHRSPPFIVGIGASAGGIEALKNFFAYVPADSGAAYVVILHLSPDHDSHLADILQLTSSMPVLQVTERITIEPNHVYVVPPNKLLNISDASITLLEITRAEQRRAPVDLFFRSLADANGARAVCVVLSGTGPNGSAGLKRVKEYGGLAIAQDPNEAQYPDMPSNSIATGLVDFVLPVAEMPARIQAFHERFGAEPEASPIVSPEEQATSAMRDVLTTLRVRTRHDFSNYKPRTLQRRVLRRAHLHGADSLTAYARVMQDNPDEAISLMKELLISVTNFFRDVAAFEALERRIVPRLFHQRSPQDQVRVWAAGCATGEEAYSIAMLLAEHAATLVEQPSVQIFATDLDEEAIARGRNAYYSDAEVADVSQERLQRFFTRQARGYRVRQDLRDLVLFAQHNLLKDPPFGHLDLISCRNLLIYLNRSVQERIVETFHSSLRPGGYLLLGAAESPDTAGDLFTAVDKSARIYESRTAARRLTVPFTVPPVVARPVPRSAEPGEQDKLSPDELHLRLLERYAPPSLVVTDQHAVVHMSDRVGRYLEVRGGEPTRDLLKLVHPDLRADLRAALHQAARENAIVEVKRVRVDLGDGRRVVDLRIHPVMHTSEPPRGYLLVTFDEHDATAAEKDAPRALSRASDSSDERLEEELASVKRQLRTTIEEYETQVEEAKAANEELQALNEELRSSAEELETSTEELQSVNEELTTVNQELKIKIDELAITNNNFQNLINSTDIATIFLDRELRLKLWTPSVAAFFNLLKTDVGRPLSDMTTQLVGDTLHRDAERVLNDLRTIDHELQTRDGRWMLVRVRPYRTTNNGIDGVVITVQDITDRHRAEDTVRRSEERLRLLIESAIDYAIFTLTPDGTIDSWNSGAERMFGYRAEEIIGQPFNLLFTPEDRASGVPARQLHQAIADGRALDERFHVRRDGSRFYCSGTTTRLGETLGFAKIARDLSAQRDAAEAARVVQAALDDEIRQRTDHLEAEVHARESAHVYVTELLRKVVTAQEDERARIARDLHDQLGQQLTALRLALEKHRDQLVDANSPIQDVERALVLARAIDSEIDFLAWELRPAVLDDLGLAAALPRFVRDWSRHYGIPSEYRDSGFAVGQLSRDAELVFYRVAQEALNNVAKHAHASRVDVLLESRDHSVVLVIEDDGDGFDPADQSLRDEGIGMAGMRERAATIGARLDIESAQGQGTSIFLRCEPAAKPADIVGDL